MMLVAMPDWCSKNEDASSYLSGLGSKMNRRLSKARKIQRYSSWDIIFADRSLFPKLHRYTETVMPAKDPVFKYRVQLGTFYIQTITIHLCSPQAHGNVITQNDFS